MVREPGIWKSALMGRGDLKRFGDNRVLLFALQLSQGIEDIGLVATEALTDGSNDKKCDLVFVDSESGKAIVAQGYWGKKEGAGEAPRNKASDLNTACAWLFGRQYGRLPDSLRTAAEELEEAIVNNEINSIEIWYVHNLLESKNVQDELGKVEEAADALLRRNFPGHSIESVTAREIGSGTLDTWYRSTKVPILVTETLSFETFGGFETRGLNWKAYSTSVSAHWLREMFLKHGKNLFSANVRDYLGSRQSSKNINNNIKITAQENPSMFWVFNNGITALVNDFSATSDDDAGLLEVRGIAIVNGAQTTGALGSTDGDDLSSALVPARFVKCSDPQAIEQIILYNNSQNKIEAADFRSNDRVQNRLRREFEKIGGLQYLGGRRGGAEDAIRRPRGTISSYSAGQALTAFHQEPAVAYNQRSNIWKSDRLYSSVFNERTTAKHIVFCHSLLKAIEKAKGELRAVDAESRTRIQERQWTTLSQRGSTFLLTAAVAGSLEIILDRPIADPFKLRFSDDVDYAKCEDIWMPVLSICLSFVSSLNEALGRGNLKNKILVTSAIESFADHIDAIREANAAQFREFGESVRLSV